MSSPAPLYCLARSYCRDSTICRLEAHGSAEETDRRGEGVEEVDFEGGRGIIGAGA